jgi:hypothetical protein
MVTEAPCCGALSRSRHTLPRTSGATYILQGRCTSPGCHKPRCVVCLSSSESLPGHLDLVMLSAVRALFCTPHNRIQSLVVTTRITGASHILGRPFSDSAGSLHTQHSDPFGVPPAMPQRRVVVTGIGVVSPLGVGTSISWQGLIQGDTGVRGLVPSDLPEVGPCVHPGRGSRPAILGWCR